MEADVLENETVTMMFPEPLQTMKVELQKEINRLVNGFQKETGAHVFIDRKNNSFEINLFIDLDSTPQWLPLPL